MLRRFASLLLLIALAACTAAPTPTPTTEVTLAPPTLTFTPRPTNTPPPTSTDIPALPPTWTPAVTATTVRATDAPTATFTPTVDPNATLLAQPTRAECATFGVDFGRTPSTFTIGTEPTVVWRAVSGALTYRIILRDDQSNVLLVTTSGGTSYTFDEGLFAEGRNYAWEVRPLDVSGNQICVSRGAPLTPVIG
ncbi:MAG: hypothetical protein IPK17_01315 [Chloroflexi bacterium]|uniref:hypothetical protein n=1 Tax=Candidatus Flexifilum breve TaxID=3140694 RepID=UPI0031362ECD|nr:hypothetical protein [Chloroflexota bacterium]